VSDGAGASISSPLRILGLTRILAGGWFIRSGVATLRQYPDLVPQAKRLFGGDIGATDAPIRALLVLILAVGLVLLGPVLIVKGIGWMCRLLLPHDGPKAIARDEVFATLRHHQLPAYAVRPTEPNWPLRHQLSDELAEMPWWRRDLLDIGVRAFVRSCGGALVLAGLSLALPLFTTDDLLGPFPAEFVTLLLFVTAIWAALALMLIPPDGLRIESVELPLPVRAGSSQALRAEEISESRPLLLPREFDGLAVALGMLGVMVQCLILSWWDLSPIGFPLLATSIIRHTGSIAGGILFFVLGDRMLTAAAELLLRFRYESLLVLIDDARDGMVARAAAIRSESRGLTGSRHILAAVGGPHVRDSALSTVFLAGPSA
jgi:hypothetical protein